MANSFLTLARRVNNFDPSTATDLYRFLINSELVGFIRPSFAEYLKETSNSPFVVEGTNVSLQSQYDSTPNLRTKSIEIFLVELRERDLLPALKGWRSERFSVYGSDGRVLCGIDRSATGLFGVMQYGIHLNGYVKDAHGNIKLWVAQRSITKTNPVAGGIAEGSHPQETVIKESGEEAGIFDKALLTGIKSCGAVSLYHDDEIRGLQAETEFVYDLELPASFQPTPEDGEVEGFVLMNIEEAKAKLIENMFTVEASVVFIDFLVRHSLLTPAEPGYAEILMLLHRNLPFPVASFD